jgi:integrase/recombinase XerD
MSVFQFLQQSGKDCLRGCLLMLLVQAIDGFFDGYFSTHDRSAKTRAAYRSDLDQFAAYAPNDFSLISLEPGFIEKWAGELRGRNYSPASMRRKMVVLKVFCSYWVRKGILSESPFWRVSLSFGRVRQLPRALSEVEIQSLLAQAARSNSASQVSRKGSVLARGKPSSDSSRTYRPLRNFALVDLLFATGMRVGEVSALNLEDFLTADSVFRVKGKGGRDRLAFVVDAQSIQTQREHIEARSRLNSNSRALFVNATGGRLSTQGMANIISQFRKDAGIERHITPHMLRHTVATLLLRNGVDIRVVQEFLGHASIATTQRYTHVTKDHLVRVLRERHPSLNISRAS